METFNLPITMSGMGLGVIMKEAVRRAIQTIRNQLHVFEVEEKLDYDGNNGDIVTTCDRAAQKVYVRMLQRCFPGFGIIAEEDGLRIPCTLNSTNAYFTVDGVDGTRALKRGQSKAIGTMLALVVNNEVIAVFIGDVMTQEIYGYRPSDGDSDSVYRISKFEIGKRLAVNPTLILAEQFVLLRDRPDAYSVAAQKIIRPKEQGGLFENLQVEGGSIGIGMAQLWKGEFGATILRPGVETPWDSAPVWGILSQMGFVAFAIEPNGLRPFHFVPSPEIQRRSEEIIIVHSSRQEELLQFAATTLVA